MMSRLVALVAALGLVAAGCASSVETIEAASPDAEQPVVYETGREAILANHTEGKPYVLWYWGAH